MRYETDVNGYITCVFWGCYSGKCKEYTGEIPSGYESLADWEANAVIGAYYIDGNGNLVLDAGREQELKILHEQQAADYAPVVHKELYAQQEVLESQYLKATATGKTLELMDAKNMAPIVKLTGISPGMVRIFAQTKNMLRNDMVSKEVSGITFEKLASGKVNVSGTATEDIEYTIAGSSVNTEPLFALLKDRDYYLWTTGFECEFRWFNGEVAEQVYLGSGGIINLPENKEVTHVVIKIPSEKLLDTWLAPTLYLGTSEGAWADNNTKVTTFDLTDQDITDTANASLMISGGLVILQADGKDRVIAAGNVKLLSGYNLVYTNQGSTIEIEYCTNVLDVSSLEFLQGKNTSAKRFMILDDGSIVSAAGVIGGWKINETTLYADLAPPIDYTTEDIDKIRSYIMGQTTLTDEEIKNYDITGDGKVQAIDYTYIRNLIEVGISKTHPGKLVLDSTDYFNPIKIYNSKNEKVASFGVNGASNVNNSYLAGTFSPIEGIRHSFNAKTTMTDTGFTMTIPANSYVNVTVNACYNYSKPTAIVVELDSGAWAEGYVANNNASATLCCYAKEETVLRVKAKYSSEASNYFWLYGYMINT